MRGEDNYNTSQCGTTGRCWLESPGSLELMMRETGALDSGGLRPENDLGYT